MRVSAFLKTQNCKFVIMAGKKKKIEKLSSRNVS